MILIQTYQELYYALKVLQILRENKEPKFQQLHTQIINQIEKLS